MAAPNLDSAFEEALRREIVACAQRVHGAGWVANHDGNLSARLDGNGRLLCSPTAVSKADVRPETLIVVDADGQLVQGTRRSFSELALHRAAYAARPDIGVVLHAHPPAATAFCVARKDLGHPFMAEAVVSLGPVLPRVGFCLPGSPALLEDIAAGLAQADVLMLDGHGVLSVGGSVEQAWLRMELVEHLAKISLAAQAIGGVVALTQAELAGLAKKQRPASSPDWSSLTGAPAPAAPAPAQHHFSGDQPRGRPDVGNLVQDALRRLR